ncbi:MAG: nuclear transport factor 2 family protein [Betaproteobacteria bacterium]
MGRFAALIVSLLCIWSAQEGRALAAGAVEMQVEHIVSQSIEEYNRAMEAKDPSGWLKYFTDNVSRTDLRSTQQGKAEFADYYRWEFKNFQAKCVPKKILITGRSAAVVFLWDAIYQPSGEAVQLEMVAVYEMASSGKFESVNFFYDTAKAAKYFAQRSAASN